MLDWLKRLTLDQWAALADQYPVDTSASERHHYKVAGMYLVVGLVLWFNRFHAWDSYGWVPADFWPEAPHPKVYNRIWWAWMVSIAYFVPGWLYARYVLGMKLSELGFRAKGFLEHLPVYLLCLGVVMPFVVLFSYEPGFRKTYPLAWYAADSWSILINWEVAYAIQFVSLEFFFRGLMLFAGAKILGRWVVPFMVMPYLMLHFTKPEMEAIGSIIAGTVLGVLALRTRSIYAGMMIHITVAWSMDLLSLWHRGALQELLD